MCQCYIAGCGGQRCVVGDEFAIWHKLHESDIIFTYISYKIIIGSTFIGILLVSGSGVLNIILVIPIGSRIL